MTAQNYLAIIYLQKEQISYFCCYCDFSAAAEVLEQQQQQTTHGPAAGGRLAAAHLPAAGRERRDARGGDRGGRR